MQYPVDQHLQEGRAAFVRWKGRFWERRYWPNRVLDEIALLGRVRYIISHGPKEGLVRTARNGRTQLAPDDARRHIASIPLVQLDSEVEGAPANPRSSRSFAEKWAEHVTLALTAAPAADAARVPRHCAGFCGTRCGPSRPRRTRCHRADFSGGQVSFDRIRSAERRRRSGRPGRPVTRASRLSSKEHLETFRHSSPRFDAPRSAGGAARWTWCSPRARTARSSGLAYRTPSSRPDSSGLP